MAPDASLSSKSDALYADFAFPFLPFLWFFFFFFLIKGSKVFLL